MQLSHTRPLAGVSFDEPNLVSSAGLVPLVALAEQAGLGRLADERLSVPTDKGANAGRKVAALVAGMVAGADSIDDCALLRTAACAGSSTAAAPPRRSARFCGPSASGTSGNSTRSPPGSWSGLPS